MRGEAGSTSRKSKRMPHATARKPSWELLPQLEPPAIPDGGDVSLPMEAVEQLLAGAARRRSGSLNAAYFQPHFVKMARPASDSRNAANSFAKGRAEPRFVRATPQSRQMRSSGSTSTWSAMSGLAISQML